MSLASALLLLLAAAVVGVSADACPEGHHCYNNNCHADGSCVSTTSCQTGWWGDLCDKECKPDGNHCTNGASCYKATGCSSCQSGWWGDYCEKPCQYECSRDKCDRDTGLCTNQNYCKDGLWGKDYCDKSCGHCSSGDCDKDDAHCSGGCVSGYWDPRCNTTCPSPHCSTSHTCNPDDGTCSQSWCVNGYYGLYCNHTCPEHCSSYCDKETAKCNSCDDTRKWWGDHCDNECKNATRHCTSTTTCSQDGRCGACEHGYWDRASGCSKPCNSSYHCKEGYCYYGDGTCYSSCETGYWGETADGADKICDKQCNPDWHCKDGKCRADTGKCDTGSSGCALGWWGEDCDKACPVNCAGNRCDRDDGECYSSCTDPTVWYGPFCDQNCTAPGRHCKLTSGNNCNIDGSCDRCIDGYYGKATGCNGTCDPSHHCRRSGACADNGECSSSYSCVTGWWGDTYCEKNCHIPGVGHGKGRVCNDDNNMDCVVSCAQSTGEISSCDSGWWGISCNYSCSGHCGNNDYCYQETGICSSSYSCQSGWWGDNCDKECPAACPSCSRETGLCIHDCDQTNTHYGPKCDLNCTAPERHCDFNGYRCKQDGSCSRCIDGFWDSPNGCTQIKNASYHCTSYSHVTGQCDPSSCEHGWWGANCDIAGNASYHCPNNQYDRDTGKCASTTGLCDDAFYGELCDKACSVNCKRCRRDNGVCNDGSDNRLGCVGDNVWYGAHCESPCVAEWRHCVYDSQAGDDCYRTGACDKCEVGYWGTSQGCNNTCEVHCADGTCDGTEGTCPDWQGCAAGYWKDCTVPCPNPNCTNNECNRNTGRCSAGCAPGKWGEDCDKDCYVAGVSHCLNDQCDRTTGRCQNGLCQDGWMQKDLDADDLCTARLCDAGYYAESLTVCKECPVGRARRYSSRPKSQDLSTCILCDDDEYANTTGSVSCTDCPAGRYTEGQGSSECKTCGPGTEYVQWQSGASRCRECRKGTASANPAEDCVSCTPGRYAPHDGMTECAPCAIGYYNNRTGSRTCEQCKNNALTRGVGQQGCFECGEAQYFDFSDPNDVKCSWCPDGRTSMGNSRECDIECPSCKRGGVCAEGYMGQGCVSCAPGFYTDAGECFECTSFPWALFLGLLLFIGLLALLYYKGLDLHNTIRLKIAANYIQLVIITASIVVLWPGAIEWLKKFLRVVLLAFDSVHSECWSTWSWHAKVGAAVWVPALIVSSGIAVDQALVYKRKQLKKADHGMNIDDEVDRKLREQSCTIRRLLFMFISLAYAPIMRMMFSMHQCKGTPPVLVNDTSLRCDTSAHDSMVAFADAFAVIIGFGFPGAMVGVVLWIKSTEKGLHHGDYLDSFGSIYETYQDEVAWFEAVILVRKALMLIIIGFFDSGVGQSLLNLMFSGMYAVFVWRMSPFRHEYVELYGRMVDLPNMLELLSSVITCVNQFIAFLVGVSNNETASIFFGVIFFMVNIAAFAALVMQYHFKSKAILEKEKFRQAYMELGSLESELEGDDAPMAKSLLGDHIKETFAEHHHAQKQLRQALKSGNMKVALSVYQRLQHVEGRLLGEVERQTELATQTLNVDWAQDIQSWKESHNNKKESEERQLAQVKALRDRYRQQCALFDQTYSQALAHNAWYPHVDDAWRDLQRFVDAQLEKTQEFVEIGMRMSSYPIVSMAVDLEKKMNNTQVAKLGKPATTSQIDKIRRKWKDKVNSFRSKQDALVKAANEKLERRMQEAKREAAIANAKEFLVKTPALSSSAAAAMVDDAESKDDSDEGKNKNKNKGKKDDGEWSDKDTEELVKLYNKMDSNVRDLDKMYDKKVTPLFVSTRQFRELQELWRESQKDLGRPELKHIMVKADGSDTKVNDDDDGGDEGAAEGQEGASLTPQEQARKKKLEQQLSRQELLVLGLQSPDQRLTEQWLMNQFGYRHKMAKEALSSGRYDLGQKRIALMIRWMQNVKVEITRREKLYMDDLLFNRCIQMCRLYSKAISVLTPLLKSRQES